MGTLPRDWVKEVTSLLAQMFDNLPETCSKKKVEAEQVIVSISELEGVMESKRELCLVGFTWDP